MRVNRALALIVAVLVLIGLGRESWSSVSAAPPLQEALAIITSPTNAAIVRGQVSIMGSATHPAFQFYKVEFAREPVTGGDEVWSIIGAIVENPVINGQLTVWDTRQVPDGSYSLRLRVVRIDGNYDEAFVRQIVVANAQPERPTETPTPEASPTPTITPTPLPPTPTIVIEQPPRPTERVIPGVTRTPLPTPIPEQVSVNIDPTPFQNACLFGMGAILGLFLVFGMLAAFRNLIYALLGRRH